MTFSIFAFPRCRGGVAEMHDTTRPGTSLHWKRSVDVHLHGFSLSPRMAPLLAVRTGCQSCLPAWICISPTDARFSHSFDLDPSDGPPPRQQA